MNIKDKLIAGFAISNAAASGVEDTFGWDDDPAPPSTPPPAKRKPGRPRKTDAAPATAKRRGRPPTKNHAALAKEVTPARKPGRPRKNPLTATTDAPAAAVATAEKRKPGRPRKVTVAEVMAVPAAVEAEVQKIVKVPRKKGGTLAALAPKMPEGDVPPTDAERKAQLRCLVREYMALTDQMRATKQRTGGYTMKDTGEFRPSPLSQDQKDILLANADEQEKQRARVLRQIDRILAHFPIYATFIEKVPGVGVACAGMLLASIDWTRCEKVSALQRFCGLAVRVDEEGRGKAQRKQAGVKLDFRQEIKTALWHCFAQSMTKAKDGRRVVAGVGEDGKKVYATDDDGNEIRTGGEAVQSSPYFIRMRDYKHRLLNSPRYVEASNTFDGRKGGRAIIHDMSWRPGAQLFIEHLYILGRTMAGLPVWPSYEAAKLGYAHGGKVCVNAPKMLTLTEAYDAIGVF